jgi:BirA family biotin operon repressor/biotin-[acetyl-CoA-carboxylase] ligase
LTVLPIVSSTQDQLRSSLPTPPAVLAAEIQTDGHGRQGKPWISSQPLGLWVSILLEVKPVLLPILSLLGTVAASDAIRVLIGHETTVKWPNDLLLQNRKVAGLLVETVARPERPPLALLGLGLNLHQQLTDFPEDLKKCAISLRQASGRHVPRAQALAAFLDCLSLRLNQTKEEILTDWRSAFPHRGRALTVRTGGETLSGVAESLDEAGHLHLRLANGEVRILASGETHFPA